MASPAAPMAGAVLVAQAVPAPASLEARAVASPVPRADPADPAAAGADLRNSATLSFPGWFARISLGRSVFLPRRPTDFPAPLSFEYPAMAAVVRVLDIVKNYYL